MPGCSQRNLWEGDTGKDLGNFIKASTWDRWLLWNLRFPLGLMAPRESLGFFLFIHKYRPPVREKWVRDPVSGQDLVKYMVVAWQCLLSVEPGSGYSACRIIYSYVQWALKTSKPLIWRCVHLFHFSKIGASGSAWVGILYWNQVFLYFVCFFFVFCRFLFFLQLPFYPLFLLFRYFWWEDIFWFQDPGHTRYR